MNHNNSITWRCIALIACIGNLIFNYSYKGIASLGEITNRYNVVFTPAGYAFAIWGVIYLSTTIYVVYSLMPRQRPLTVHERFARSVTLLLGLGICWLLAYTNLQIGLSVCIIAVMLIVSLLSLRAVRAAVSSSIIAKLIILPFACYAAWLSVATTANIAIWLKSLGWSGGAIGEERWAVIMLVIAAILGVLCLRRLNTIFYPLVIAWACIAIYVSQQAEYPIAAYTALVAAAVQVITILWQLLAKRPHRTA